MERIVALCRSATHPSMKNVALTEWWSNNSRTCWTCSFTREGKSDHRSWGMYACTSEGWKYSSTSTVSAFCIRPSYASGRKPLMHTSVRRVQARSYLQTFATWLRKSEKHLDGHA